MGWSFVDSNKAWYSKIMEDNELLIKYDDGDKTYGEFNVVWYDLNNKQVPRLEVFSDAWHILFFHGQDFLRVLNSYNDCNVTKEKLIKELKLIDFEDATEYKMEK